jgi:hypothetical protein
MDNKEYSEYLEDWEAPIHPQFSEELEPLTLKEFQSIDELSESEEEVLEEVYGFLVEPVEDYNHLIAALKHDKT